MLDKSIIIGTLSLIYGIDAVFGIYVYYKLISTKQVLEEEECFSHLNLLIVKDESNPITHK
jgi:hypothetical protein